MSLTEEQKQLISSTLDKQPTGITPDYLIYLAFWYFHNKNDYSLEDAPENEMNELEVYLRPILIERVSELFQYALKIISTESIDAKILSLLIETNFIQFNNHGLESILVSFAASPEACTQLLQGEKTGAGVVITVTNRVYNRPNCRQPM